MTESYQLINSMRKFIGALPKYLFTASLLTVVACSAQNQRGIADKRSNFEKFIPFERDPSQEGLKQVKPFFKRANRSEITRAIDRACTGGKAGSSVFEPRTGEGYYVNCDPRNRQLANGYVPSNPRQRPGARGQ
jgi:hypothetical protein